MLKEIKKKELPRQYPTTPTFLYKCPKCGKEKMCICIDENYCMCTMIVNGVYNGTKKQTRMKRVN